jgi:hypothetical protein
LGILQCFLLLSGQISFFYSGSATNNFDSRWGDLRGKDGPQHRGQGSLQRRTSQKNHQTIPLKRANSQNTIYPKERRQNPQDSRTNNSDNTKNASERKIAWHERSHRDRSQESCNSIKYFTPQNA